LNSEFAEAKGTPLSERMAPGSESIADCRRFAWTYNSPKIMYPKNSAAVENSK
jgi:hypothetical protein